MGKKTVEPQKPEGVRIKQVCYVCHQTISGVPEYVGKDTWRHHRCAPGGQRWINAQMEMKKKERSELLPYFLSTEGLEDDS